MEKLERLEPKVFGAGLILKQFAVHKCDHDKEPKPAMKCLKSMLGTDNPNRYVYTVGFAGSGSTSGFSNRYFIVSQDAALRERARKVPGTPVLYLHRSAPTLEKPSEMSETSASKAASDRYREHLMKRER
jgi:U3 small nucleolar RNA-associated protein 23